MELQSENNVAICISGDMEQIDDDMKPDVKFETNSKKICSICVRTFSARKGLLKHFRTFHPTIEVEKSQSQWFKVTCSVCETKCRTISGLQSHLQRDHKINLCFEKRVFYTMEDFEQWKIRIERESQSAFVKVRGSKQQMDGKTIFSFYCHRSGSPKIITGDRKRRLKNAGSQKIGFNCPAHITAIKDEHEEIMEIEVEYQSTHIGHECELLRLPFTKDEKEKLAEYLRTGLPIRTLLQNIRKEFSPKDRISFTTRKDLYNICKEFKIERPKVLFPKKNRNETIEIKKENNVLIFLDNFEYGVTEEQLEADDSFDCVLSANASDSDHQQREHLVPDIYRPLSRFNMEDERAAVVLELQTLIKNCNSQYVSLEELHLLRESIKEFKEKRLAIRNNTSQIVFLTKSQ